MLTGAPRPSDVAIIGIGCRLPGGAVTPDDFWRLLCAGVDAITEVPPDRFDVEAVFDPEPGTAGKLYARWGGFIEDVDRFDAEFFGISPREAARIDPQQRLLLEVAWEALEDAGQVPGNLAGSRTGVFVGVSTQDYGTIQVYPANRQFLDGHSSSGGANSIAANRLSYLLDLRGPSLAVDTACSSSLTAVHLACRGLAAGECELAIAGGVNLILIPEVMIGYCQAGMLSPDGRCRAFDARANGFVRGEGAATVVLKPLGRAVADRDRIYAVIRASAVNQDGRTTGLMVPSAEAQQSLIRDALSAAGVPPSAIQYVDAHGTGTPVGDPIEAAAIGAVLGRGRAADQPCLIGSAKTNVGHLEAGAGIVGLIKAALAVQHRQVPPNLHFTAPNPGIPLDDLHLRVPTCLEPWPPADGPAMAGVNSFGFGGANAHVVLQEPPAPDANARPDSRRTHILPLSARTPEALHETARRHRDLLRTAEASALADICSTAAVRRTHHPERLAVVGGSPEALGDALDQFLAGQASPALVAGHAQRSGRPKVAFVFSGMGPQWWGMGRGLMAEEPLVREVLAECDRVVSRLADWSLLHEFSGDQASSHVDEPAVVQAANCALQIALAELWRAWGVVPDAVVGHSAGEMAAAYAAGALSLPDALRVAFHRGRLAQRVKGTGTMLAVALGADEAQALIEPYQERVTVAAFNSPTSVTLAGARDALEAIARSLQARDLFARFLVTEVPYHGPTIAPLSDELERSLHDLDPREARISIVSGTTGDWASGSDLNGAYWARNLCQPVRFGAAVGRLAEQGHEFFLEVGAHPALAVSIKECLAARPASAAVLPTLRRGEDEPTVMLRSLAALHVRGYPVDWAALYPAGQCVSLPAYPWQRERHWLETAEAAHAADPAPAGTRSGHPLLGWRLHSVQPIWQVDLGDAALAYLADHRIDGRPVLPGAAFAEMLLAAARRLAPDAGATIEEVDLQRLLVFDSRPDTRLQVVGDAGASRLEVFSAPNDGSSSWTRPPNDGSSTWTRHASARVGRAREGAPEALDLAAIGARCWKTLALPEHYEDWSRGGLQLGPAFRCLAEARVGESEALARATLPPHLSASAGAYHVHPCLLDAAFQVLLGAAVGSGGILGEGAPVVAGLRSLRVHEPVGGGPLWVYARLQQVERTPGEVSGDAWLADGSGRVVLSCAGVRVRLLPAEASREPNAWLYELAWEEVPLPTATRAQAVALPPVARVRDQVQPLAQRLAAAVGAEVYYGVVEPALNRLARGFAHRALRAPSTLAHRALRPPSTVAHRRLVARLAEIVDGWPEDHSDSSEAARLVAEHPEHRPLIELVQRCGEQLSAIVQAQLDAREILFSGDGLDLLEGVYASIPWSRLYNSLVGEAIAAAREPANSATLRVLEIGAGLGSTTSAVLARLRPGTFEYTFTDISPFFLARAEARFAGMTSVRIRRLDVEQDPVGQGFEPHSFHVVVAGNVLHGTADLAVSLHNIRRLLAPGGLLVLQELTRHAPWLDILFGGLDGWWRFTDTALRPRHPLLLAEGWRDVLEACQFDRVATLADPEQPDGTLETVFLARAPARQRRWLVFADRGGVARRLADALQARGDDCILVYAGEHRGRRADGAWELVAGDEDGLARVLGDVAGGDLQGVLHFWSLDLPSADGLTAEALLDAQRLGCGSVLALAHVLQRSGTIGLDVCLFTANAQPVDGLATPLELAQAPLWGLGRVLMTEQLGARCRLIDLSAAPTAEEVAVLVAELDADDFEEELALRGDRRLARRVQRLSLVPPGPEPTREVLTDTTPFAVEIGTRGVLDSFRLCEVPPVPPGPGEVAVRTVAAGLNFKDVLLALGALPPGPGEEVYQRLLGIESAGVVVACGAGVERFKPGDEVLVAFGARHFASRLVSKAQSVVPKPACLSFEEAVTLPAAFVTAHYALNHLAHMAAGERVLIHSASGGVGLAAVQLCQQAGVEIFATAGSPEKRRFLQALGVQHVMDSRSLAFADEIVEATRGEGVDVILNTLPGEAAPKGLSILRPFGRFLQIDKQDIARGAALDLAPFKRGLTFAAIDLSLFLLQPDRLKELLKEINGHLSAGHFRPVPFTAYPVGGLGAALTHMSRAKHTGKLVLTYE